MRTCACPRRRRIARRADRRQRGVTLLFVLLALVIMLVAAVALVRSFNTSLATSGNLGFQRDLANQSERATAAVLPLFEPAGALGTTAARADHAVASNYRATMLPVNDAGIPLALLSDDAFDDVATPANDIVVAEQAVTVRWVVDRLCNTVGDESTLTGVQCAVGAGTRGGSASDSLAPQLLGQFSYRLSVRVTGPRNTQAYYQTTFVL